MIGEVIGGDCYLILGAAGFRLIRRANAKAGWKLPPLAVAYRHQLLEKLIG